MLDECRKKQRLPHIIATGPSGFPGASQIMCGWLRQLATAGVGVSLVSDNVPYALKGMTYCPIRYFEPVDFVSNALGTHGAVSSTDALKIASISERICRVAANLGDEDRIIIWGTYLFPFGIAAAIAHDVVRVAAPACRLWITPTGSDVTELAGAFYHLGRDMLERKAGWVFTYSSSFAREVQSHFNLHRGLDVVLPTLDLERFKPISQEERMARRSCAGLNPGSLVISHHSNMRPVKQPDKIVESARHVANALAPQQVELLMMGPPPPALVKQEVSPLKTHWLGVISDVEYFLQMADIELNLSTHDSFNLSIAEALACGLPVISTQAVGIAPFVREARCGVLLNDTGSSAAGCQCVSNEIVRLARSMELRTDMSTSRPLKNPGADSF